LLFILGMGAWFSIVAVRRGILPSFFLYPIMKDNKLQPKGLSRPHEGPDEEVGSPGMK
jgi:hypothetical protein